MCKHARMHTCMHGDHVGAVRGICRRVSITSSPPATPSKPRSIQPCLAYEPLFSRRGKHSGRILQGGRNKAGSFFVVDRNRQLRFWFMTVHLIPIGIWKMLRKEFYYSFVSNYLNLNLILLTRKKVCFNKFQFKFH